MKPSVWFVLLLCGVCSLNAAQTNSVLALANSITGTNSTRRDYVLSPADVVQVKVYQEDDLDAKVRLSPDGSVTLPLLGQVKIGGKTREQAAAVIRDKLAEKYLVNPQVTVDVLEFSKRRFTVLGQVQRPGTFEFPADQSLNLLQALSMAGGYTRLGAANKVTVQRGEGAEKKVFKLDADSMAKEAGVKIFEVLPDDTISVGEKIF